MNRSSEARSQAGWVLVAGFVLASLGLVAESRPQETGENPTAGNTEAIPFASGYGTSDSNGSMIAVTGMDVTGGSLLFLIDTQSRHLTVYQATGGTKSTMNIKWVGARNIDLDLQVDGWNDKSEYSYKTLAERFQTTSAVTLPQRK